MRKFILTGLLLAATTSSADALFCGNTLFTGEERFDVTKGEVRAACGTPKENYGSAWIYYKNSDVYLLTFDSRGLLNSVRSRPSF